MSRASRYRADLISRGLCRNGPHPRGDDGTGTMCCPCKDEYNAAQRERGAKLRAEGKCRACMVKSETAYCDGCRKKRKA